MINLKYITGRRKVVKMDEIRVLFGGSHGDYVHRKGGVVQYGVYLTEVLSFYLLPHTKELHIGHCGQENFRSV